MPIIIKNFSKHYETSDNKKVKEMKWLALPIKFDGLKYRRLMKMSGGLEILGTWIILLQLSAKMPVRGTLATHDGDLTLDDISLMTDCPLKSLKKALSVLSSKEIGWIQNSSDNLPTISEDSRTTLQDTTGQNNTEQDNVEKDLFNRARKIYPGTKRGNDTEFDNFAKKHNDFKGVLSKLESAVLKEISYKSMLKKNNQFCPEWKNFQTWINKRCWEQEFDFEGVKNKSTERSGNLPHYTPPETGELPTEDDMKEFNKMKAAEGL